MTVLSGRLIVTPRRPLGLLLIRVHTVFHPVCLQP